MVVSFRLASIFRFFIFIEFNNTWRPPRRRRLDDAKLFRPRRHVFCVFSEKNYFGSKSFKLANAILKLIPLRLKASFLSSIFLRQPSWTQLSITIMLVNVCKFDLYGRTYVVIPFSKLWYGSRRDFALLKWRWEVVRNGS